MAQITDLYIYPVKSLKGIALKEVHTGLRGFQYDREWMITDSKYHFISQREIESMASLKTGIDSASLILCSNANQFSVYLHSEKLNKVQIDENVEKYVQQSEKGEGEGRGGMESKIKIAKGTAAKGIVTYIANGKREDVILDIMAGKPVGTKFTS